ncbi:NADP-specific glutamate dehydrogenase [Bifiguratus adelaidae]|uniref:Glutamate dehydrogenase n=1 Tax=Bifiguratus adelaidae TaxID=1938954 RepID=A0A261Y3Q3_9FUNG|nr:NADP-specific glutamate dehydrogenase [Bifiguratus adelaidae]
MVSEPEFQQAVKELELCLRKSKLFSIHPELERALPVIKIPERIIQFRVTWEDDKGNMQVNNGFRVQFNSTLGPYKGGLRFHPTVNLSVLKFLGYEQTFKNALTGISMGGGKGGADFDPKGKSDAEIRDFCHAFMRELSRHIGANRDVPAGDIGVGGREIGFLFGAYKEYRNVWDGALTGKGLDWGGSYIRTEATGYGLIYYVDHMIHYVSPLPPPYSALKAIELGAKVLTLSDSKGLLVAKDDAKGFTPQDIHTIADIKLARKSLADGLKSSSSLATNFDYIPGERPWKHVPNNRIDIALPCATQNELDEDDAQVLLEAGCQFVAEGSNMGCTIEAIEVFENSRTRGPHRCWYAPGKASNCGGVAVSGLEMAQNAQRTQWTPEQVDTELAKIMENCFKNCVKTAQQYAEEYDQDGNVIAYSQKGGCATLTGTGSQHRWIFESISRHA